jgi:hypothetical protein
MAEPFPSTQESNQSSHNVLLADPNTLVPAHEVFPTIVEFDAMVRQHIAAGDLTAIDVTASEYDGRYILPSIDVTADDIPDESKELFNTISPNITEGDAEKLGLADNPALIERKNQAIAEEISDAVKSEMAWFLADETIKEYTEKGYVSQVFKIQLTDTESIDLVNFSGILLDEDRLAEAANTLTRLYNLTGGTLAKVLKGIAILPAEAFGSSTWGQSLRRSKTIKLNEVMFDPAKFKEMEEKNDYSFDPLGANSPFEACLTHEAEHLIEGDLSAFSEHSFKARLGWTNPEYRNFVDDYGTVQTKKEAKRYLPDKTQYVRVGEGQQKVDVIAQFGRKLYEAAVPTTRYGNTDALEDAAEGFIPYVHAPERLDAIRTNALDNIIDEINGGKDPIEKAVVIPVGQTYFKERLSIGPREYGMHMGYHKPYKGYENTDAYEARNSSLGVTDDYGNVVESVTVRRPVKG